MLPASDTANLPRRESKEITNKVRVVIDASRKAVEVIRGNTKSLQRNASDTFRHGPHMRKSVEAFAEDYVAGRMHPQSRTNLFWSCTLEAEKDYTYIGAPPFHEDANASSDNVLDTLWRKKRKPSSKKGGSLFLSYPLIVLKNRLYAQALKQLEFEFPELLEIGRNINHSYDKMVAAEHVSFRDS